LKLKCDEPLSNFAFNFNLRCYTEVVAAAAAAATPATATTATTGQGAATPATPATAVGAAGAVAAAAAAAPPGTVSSRQAVLSPLEARPNRCC